MDKYKIVNGTSYHAETDDKVIEVLERCREQRIRIVLDYGDTKTKVSWGDTCDITGYVGRSIGIHKIPLLIYNKRSCGGGGILDHCILSIKTSKGKEVLYQR